MGGGVRAGGLGERGVPPVSLSSSWFGCQGPRGLPGERGRPGAPGPAVSTPGPLGDPWAPEGVPQSYKARSKLSGCDHRFPSPLQGARGNDGATGAAGPPVSMAARPPCLGVSGGPGVSSWGQHWGGPCWSEPRDLFYPGV